MDAQVFIEQQQCPGNSRGMTLNGGIPGFMAVPALPVMTVLGLAAVLWVVPSMGTQGMGTIGQRFGHADRALIESGSDAAALRPALLAADAEVEAALAR